MPIAQVLVSAAKASPAPIAKATHLTPGTTMLTRMLRATIRPATEPDLPLEIPALGTPVDREALCLPGVDAAVEDVHVCQADLAQRLLGLRRALPRAAHQHHVLVDVREISSRCSRSRSSGTL